MAEVLLFHHAQGLTPGVDAFADRLRADGHTVTVPDLFDGATFATVEEGVAHAKSIGFEQVRARGVAAAEQLAPDLVYIGFSMGAMAAQQLAQNRPGARASVHLHAAMPPEAFDSPWPDGLPMQLHVMEQDDWGDVDDARELARTIDSCELHLYPGSDHLFTDSSLPVYDAAATELVLERVLALLRRVS